MAGTAAGASGGSRTRIRAAVLLGAALVSWGAAVSLGAHRDRHHPIPRTADEILYLRGGGAAPRLALGFDDILADVYWIRSIQHFGSARRAADDADRSYRLLYPLLELTTSLDPHFTVAYRFGAIFLSEPPPGGPGRTDQAIALLERGLAADPKKWQYAHDAAFVHYWWRRDYKAAAEWFDRASRIEGAPWWLRSMAATTLAQGGDRQSSRMLWQQLHANADNDWLKSSAERSLAQLDAMDQMDALAVLIRRYREATGAAPESWEALRPYGLRGVPVDPAGTPFVLDSLAAGGVIVSPKSSLYPLPPDMAPGPGSTGHAP